MMSSLVARNCPSLMKDGPSEVSASESLVSLRLPPVSFLRSGAVTRAKSASGPGRFASSGRTRAPDQARTAPALVNLAILAIALITTALSQPPGGMDRGNPAAQIAVPRPLEARILDPMHEVFLIGEATDALDEIAVGGAVAGDEPAESGYGIEGIGVIEPVEQGQLDGGKLKTEEAPAGLQHAKGFLERSLKMGEVPHAEGDGVGIEARSGEGQGFGIAAHEAEPCIACPPPSGLDHLGADVADRGRGARARGFEDAKGHVAGATGDVEKGERRGAFGRGEPGDEVVFPQPVQAARHQIVHQIVARRDPGEDLVHEALLRLLAHPGKAKARLCVVGTIF